MTTTSFDISWLAITCNLSGADIYLGLTAGLDDVVSHALKARHMAAFPFKSIRVAAQDDKQVPLRVYTVRDPTVVQVERLPGPVRTDGFHHVRLNFRIPLTKHTHAAEPTAAEAKAASVEDSSAAAPPNSVMAFLLTIGLPSEQEDEFFENVVHDFLKKSWMSMPTLLRDIGCSSPSQVAQGEPQQCCDNSEAHPRAR